MIIGGVRANDYYLRLLLAGVPEETAREALRLASHKLPVKTKFLAREIEQGGDVDEDNFCANCFI